MVQHEDDVRVALLRDGRAWRRGLPQRVPWGTAIFWWKVIFVALGAVRAQVEGGAGAVGVRLDLFIVDG